MVESASVVMTPSPIDCSVIWALSFSRNSASSYNLRSVMSSSTPTRRSNRPCASSCALARLMTQRHSPLRWRMRWMLSNIGVLLATCSRIAACTREESSGCTRLRQSKPPFRSLIVAEHRAPARREVDVIALNVEVPQAVVGGQFGQGIALLDAAQCQRQAHALQSGRKTGAEQLHEQLQVDVEAATRQSIGEPEKARRLILDAKRHQQRRPDRKFGQRAGVVGLLLAR